MGKETKKTIKYGGRDIPITKDGTPSLVYLTKDEKKVVKSYKEQQKKKKLEVKTKELMDLLKNL